MDLSRFFNLLGINILKAHQKHQKKEKNERFEYFIRYNAYRKVWRTLNSVQTKKQFKTAKRLAILYMRRYGADIKIITKIHRGMS